MPELPEVETVKRYLERNVIGARFATARLYFSKLSQSDEKAINAFIQNEEILELVRLGKYLVFKLSNDKAIITHFRMEGRFYIRAAHESDSPHVSLIFYLQDGRKLIYDDSRRFGLMEFTKFSQIHAYPGIQKLGPEPFNINGEQLRDILQNKNQVFKKALLDQTLIAGVGNIYADELAFASRIHPKTLTQNIPDSMFDAMQKHLVDILNRAIEQNGTQVKSFTGAQDMPPHFQNELVCYGRVGEPCPSCGQPFRKTFIGGRGTTYCPNCQLNYNHPLKIAVTGKALSGKSTLLRSFKEKYLVIECDALVADLYHNNDFLTSLRTKLGINTTIDKDFVVNLAQNKSPIFDKIVALIHRRVQQEITRICKNNQQIPLILVEIPLLFEAEMEGMFDYIIGVKVNEAQQILRIKERRTMSLEQLHIYNARNSFDQHQMSMDSIIDTSNQGAETSEKQLKEFIKKVLITSNTTK